jgi:ParB family transcriptional regulator, chromosome partitioning protein
MLWNVPGAGESSRAGEGRLLAVAGALRRRQRTVLTTVSLSEVQPCSEQPRKFFDEEKLAELAASIRTRGLLQPLVLRQVGDHYELLAGERRYRAAQLAGIDRLPALIREGDDPLEIALIENIQREDLSPLEEAEALAQLIERHGYSHRAVGDLIGKSRPYVSNMLALTRLPDSVKEEVQRSGNSISRELLMGVARQPTLDEAVALWKRVRLTTISVRSFREQKTGPKPERNRLTDVILAAKRLNRALRKLENGALPECSVDTKERAARVLRRTSRMVSHQLSALQPPVSIEEARAARVPKLRLHQK